jgi:hypothetical protein
MCSLGMLLFACHSLFFLKSSEKSNLNVGFHSAPNDPLREEEKTTFK